MPRTHPVLLPAVAQFLRLRGANALSSLLSSRTESYDCAVSSISALFLACSMVVRKSLTLFSHHRAFGGKNLIFRQATHTIRIGLGAHCCARSSLREREHALMPSIQPQKPLLSTIITLIWLGCFAFIDPGPNGFLQTFFYFDSVGANAVKWAIIAVIGIIWLLVQVFMEAPPESSRLSV